VPHHHDDAETPDDAEERAWRAIVENYGDLELDEPPTAPPPAAPPSDAPFGGRFGDPRALSAHAAHEDVSDDLDDDLDDDPDDDEDGYQPPEPPPLPHPAPDRGLAWAGVFGSPAVLLASLILSIPLPTVVGYLLIVAFVGGFAYLVYTMPREPREPWDDGAQV
jgi:hypothetical protein